MRFEPLLSWTYDDGGREAAGFRGHSVGDCVVRSVAIVTGRSYKRVHAAMTKIVRGGLHRDHWGRKPSVNDGVPTSSLAFRTYMEKAGYRYVVTSDQKLLLGIHKLPRGRLIVSLRRHYTAVVNGAIRDTYDPRFNHSGEQVEARVLGYWIKAKTPKG